MLRATARIAALLAAASLLGSCAWMGLAPAGYRAVDLTREEWGAAPPSGEMRTHRPDRITIHHTAGRHDLRRSTAEKLRALQRFSQSESLLADGSAKAAWPDVPYHFYVAVDGTVAEGREARFVGDSNTPYDPTGHLLIVVEGNFEEEAPTDGQLRSLDRLVLELSNRWRIPAAGLAAHRDFAVTACPGEALYDELPRLRRLVEQR